jgi:hypothetical protein
MPAKDASKGAAHSADRLGRRDLKLAFIVVMTSCVDGL